MSQAFLGYALVDQIVLNHEDGDALSWQVLIWGRSAGAIGDNGKPRLARPGFSAESGREHRGIRRKRGAVCSEQLESEDAGVRIVGLEDIESCFRRVLWRTFQKQGGEGDQARWWTIHRNWYARVEHSPHASLGAPGDESAHCLVHAGPEMAGLGRLGAHVDAETFVSKSKLSTDFSGIPLVRK